MTMKRLVQQANAQTFYEGLREIAFLPYGHLELQRGKSRISKMTTRLEIGTSPNCRAK
jgi:hypothetical protein